jgi:hypothetical protein
VILGIPIVTSALLLVPVIQTRLVGVVTHRLSIDLNAEISIQGVNISPFSGIHLAGFLVRDQQRDTLFFAQKVRFGVESFSTREKHINLSRIRFESPIIHINQHNDRMNYTFILESLGTSAQDSVRWKYGLQGLIVRGGKISFEHAILKNPGSIKERLDFYDLDLDVAQTSNDAEGMGFSVNSFSVKEDIGLYIKDLSAKCRFEKKRIVLDDMIFRTNDSFFNLRLLEIPLNKPDDLSSDYQFRGEIEEIAIASSDVRKIFQGFPELAYPIRFSGILFGSLDNLKGRNVRCLFGEESRLVSSFDLSGLSNFNETFLFLDVEDLQTNVADLEEILTVRNGQQGGVFPPSFHKLGTIRYKGNLTGFINDLVAYGTFRTNLGVINTDLGIKLKADKNLLYGGLISTSGFNLGELLGIESYMGEIALDLEVSGSRKNSHDYFTFLDGNVVSMAFKDYVYSDIDLKGLLTHQKFDGSVKIDDPNGKLVFNGKVDMSGAIPHFNFSASLSNVQLDRLKTHAKAQGWGVVING